MKKILFALCAVATFASCTKNEVLSYDQEAIGFDNAFVDNSTRSVVDPSFSTSNMFSDFAVYGFVKGSSTDATSATVFNGIEVSKGITNAELTSSWKYSATQYWIAGAIYHFYAVAPFSGDWAIKTGTTTDAGATITFTNNDGSQDLLYAGIVEQTGLAEDNQPIAFTFNHILSKVKFSFVNNYNATSATIRVKDIKITNAYETAEAALAKDDAATTNVNEAITWGYHAGAVEIAFGNATDNQSTDAKEAVADVSYAYNNTYESYFERFVIPAPSKEWNISFIVDLLVSGQVIKTYNHTAKLTTAFEPGKAYDIAAIITAANIDPATSQEPIEFTATMNDWAAAEDKNATVDTL